MVYNKLVRDKIPEIIESQGQKANIRILDPQEYTHHLEQKLDEEVGSTTRTRIWRNWRIFWKWSIPSRKIWARLRKNCWQSTIKSTNPGADSLRRSS